MTANTVPFTMVKLLRPDGTLMTVSAWGPSSFNLTTQTLPANGVYTIVLDPSGTSTGTITVTVTSP